MKHCGTKTLETERLILRRFREDDAEAMFRNWASDPEVTKFLTWPPHASVEITKGLLSEWVSRYEDGCYFNWVMELKETGKVIGEIDAYPEAGEPHADETASQDTFSPCWMLNLAYSGKGYAYEAAHAFFDYLFKEKGARRIYAYTEDYNKPSQHLCENALARDKFSCERSVIHGTYTARGTPGLKDHEINLIVYHVL